MPSKRTEAMTLEGHVLALLAHIRALRATFQETHAALRELVGSCEQVAWTKRSMSEVAEDGYWSFVPTDRVKRAAAVLVGPTTPQEPMSEIPDAIFRLPDGSEIKCRGLFISPGYAAELAKAAQRGHMTYIAPSEDTIEAIRADEAVRDAFVDCYTLQAIVSDERQNVVSPDDLHEWDRVESVLIRAIAAVLARLGAASGPSQEGVSGYS